MVVASIRLLPSSPFLSFSPRRSPYSWRCLSSSTVAFSSIHSTSTKGEGGVDLGGNQTELIFLGTGTSEGVPRVSCLTNPLNKCEVCSKAVQPGDKNRRLNTSILIRHPNSSGAHNNILIDAGKFFYHSALRWFPAFGIRTIDAVIITHSHADAIGGLDDLRDWTNNVQPCIPIYVTKRDFEVMTKTHYYLVDTSVILPGAKVSELQFSIISEEPFFIYGLKVNAIISFNILKWGVFVLVPVHFIFSLLLNQLTSDVFLLVDGAWLYFFPPSIIVLQFTPLPVWHGQNYRSLGFRFGNICYISDVSEIPEETYPLLKDCEILILDALRPDRSTSTHFGLQKALEEVRKIQPKRTLFTGMMHLMDHDEVNDYLAKLLESEGLDAQLSYDGLRIPVRL